MWDRPSTPPSPTRELGGGLKLLIMALRDKHGLQRHTGTFISGLVSPAPKWP